MKPTVRVSTSLEISMFSMAVLYLLPIENNPFHEYCSSNNSRQIIFIAGEQKYNKHRSIMGILNIRKT